MAPSIHRVLLLAAAILSIPTAGAQPIATLRSQLALAEESADRLAQIELLRRIIDADPADSDARTDLAELWLQVGDYTMAETTISDWPEAPAGLAARVHADALWHRDDLQPDAIATLDQYLNENPDDPDVLAAQSDFLAQTGQWQRQIDLLDRLIRLRPSASLLFDRADAKKALGQYPAAIADARAAQALDPSAELVTNSLPAYERLEVATTQIAELDARLKKNPRDLTALLLQAYYWQSPGIAPRALQAADAALAIDPDSAYARLARSRALLQLEKISADESRNDNLVIPGSALEEPKSAAALIDLDVALTSSPENPGLLANRAAWFNSIGQYLLARSDADAALDLDRQQFDAAIAGILAEIQLGNPDAAVARYRALEASDPPPPVVASASDLIAQMFFAQGNLPLTIEFADLGLAAQETESLLRYKAQALTRLGRQGEATELTTRADQLGENQ